MGQLLVTLIVPPIAGVVSYIVVRHIWEHDERIVAEKRSPGTKLPLCSGCVDDVWGAFKYRQCNQNTGPAHKGTAAGHPPQRSPTIGRNRGPTLLEVFGVTHIHPARPKQTWLCDRSHILRAMRHFVIADTRINDVRSIGR